MLGLGFTAFLLVGVVLVLVGANQDGIAAALGLDLAASGFVVSLLSAGFATGMLAAGPLVDRLPRRPLFVAATLLCGLSLLTVTTDTSLAGLCVRMGLVGFGGGLYVIVLGIVTVERFGRQASRPMGVLHAAATAGAVLAPPVIIALSTRADWTLAFRATGVGYVLLSIWALRIPLGDSPALRPRVAGAWRRILCSRRILAFCVISFCYVGIETSLTIFAVPYASDGLGLAADRGRSAISAFWLGLLLGRVVLAVYRHPVDARHLCVAGLVAGAALTLGVVTGATQIELIVGAAGFGIGCVFPLLLTLAAHSAPDAAGAASGLVGSMGAFGGFVVPWLTGMLGDHAGIRFAMGSLALWCGTLALAAAVARLWPLPDAPD